MPTCCQVGRRGGKAPDDQRLEDAVGTARIGRLLGRGGMGEVCEAEHLESGRRVALKVLRSRLQNRDERARFLREGQLAASISHPHTVYIFGSDEVAGMPVISMELLPGGTLKDRVVAHGPLAPAEAVGAVLDIIGGLDAAQAAGILHRDIKPSNCFVDADGSVKVGDFGLSISTLARDVRDLATDYGGFQGTPQFAPPEQLRVSRRSARGCLCSRRDVYYLLTGAAIRRSGPARVVHARGSERRNRPESSGARSAGLGVGGVAVPTKTPAGRPPRMLCWRICCDRSHGRTSSLRLGVRFVPGSLTMIGRWSWSSDRADARPDPAGTGSADACRLGVGDRRRLFHHRRRAASRVVRQAAARTALVGAGRNVTLTRVAIGPRFTTRRRS